MSSPAVVRYPIFPSFLPSISNQNLFLSRPRLASPRRRPSVHPSAQAHFPLPVFFSFVLSPDQKYQYEVTMSCGGCSGAVTRALTKILPGTSDLNERTSERTSEEETRQGRREARS
ncbi:hypothetical protein BDY24DRAFT_396036 [Mrakia frigida]|uniref:copper metallochaperone ATX1 n=1 Tax=Mrakia frigida TaxID=29902 RepID=UPI003FCBFB12